MCSIDSVDSPLSARPAELLAPSLATDPRGRWDLSSDPFVSPSSAFTHSTTRIWKNYNRWRFIFSTRFLFPDPLISICGSVDFYFRIRWFLFPDPLGRKTCQNHQVFNTKTSALQQSCKLMKFVTCTQKTKFLGDGEMNSLEKEIRFAVIWFVEHVLSGRQIFV